MRRFLLASTILAAPFAAAAQTSQQTGTVDGMQYIYQLPAGGCSAAAPCQIVEYLHSLGSASSVPTDLATYFGAAFQAAHPNAVVVAPQLANSNADNNWGGTAPGISNGGKFAIDALKQIEATVPTNPNTVTVTGWSMGGGGTESLLVAAGPKGNVQPGVFAAGAAFDGFDYVLDPATAKATLCGVPLIVQHGSADGTVPVAPDQSLAKTLSGCPGFTYTEIPGADHGVGIAALTNGAALSQMMAAATGSNGSKPTATTPASAVTPVAQSTPAATVAPASATQPAQATNGTIIKPGGSLTDAKGNVWTISASGSIQENGKWTPGGGGTAALTIVNGTVFGLDDGHGPVNAGGWFKLSDNGQNWTTSQAPPGATTPAVASSNTAAATTTSATTLPPPVSVCSNAVPNYAASAGGFGVIGGTLYSPNGTPFKPDGINVMENGNKPSAAQILAKFPGTNFVRLAVYDFASPATLTPYINDLTSHGIFVELEDHANTSGQNAGGGDQSGNVIPQPGVTYANGFSLAAENSWYSSVASAFKNNPYVGFGTNNEPAEKNPVTGADDAAALSAWQKQTYDAIRSAGNNNPVWLETTSWGVGGTNVGYNPADYAGMTNVLWDQHVYPWMFPAGNTGAQDGSIISQIAGEAQQITSKDGKIPVSILEYGNSTTGQAIDGNWQPVVDAVHSSGLGTAAWMWDQGGPGDGLLSGDAYASDVAAHVATSGAQICAQSPIATTATQPNTSQPVTAPALAPASTAQTAPSLAAASTDQTAPPLAANPVSINQVAAMATGGGQ